MKTVYLRKFDSEGDEGVITLGKITLDDNKLTGDTPEAQQTLRHPVYDPETHGPVSAKDNPVAFFNALHLNYRGAYFWATMPE